MSFFLTLGTGESLKKSLGRETRRVLRPFPFELFQHQIPLHSSLADQEIEVRDVVRVDVSEFALKQLAGGRVVAAYEEEDLIVPVDKSPPRELEVRGREGAQFPSLRPSRDAWRILDRLDLSSSEERGVNPVTLQKTFPLLPAPQ